MAIDPLNKLCKWRSVLAGWHGGTKAMNEGGVQAMRDLMDKWLIMRVENNAVAALMVHKGFITVEEFHDQVMMEAALLDRSMEEVFPGFRTSEDGVVIYDALLALETTKKKGFPP